ncbi:MAG: endonuclease MutS2 [Clostridiales bacterium]|nr:endonuclease MutS2 [Clostridiales bacterium]
MKASENRHFRYLELDKILDMLAEYTACEDARIAAQSIMPEPNVNLAQALMNQTRDAHMLLARFGGPSFGGLRNVNNSLSRADAGSVLTMRELLDVSSLLKSIRALVQWRGTNAGVESVLDNYFSALVPNKFLEDAINSAIISEEEMSDNASPALYEIRRKIRIQESRVREQLEKLTHSSRYSKYLQENIVTMRNGRYVVPVKNEYRSEVPGLVHDTSSSGATVFIEPMAVVESNNEIKVLHGKEEEEMDRILAELSATAGSFAENIKSSYACAVELNLIFAKAQLAYSMNASVPEINDKGIINLRMARHPLIDKKSVVPVDIRVGEDFDTLVITGPNTGGKTVSIKTLGLLTLMAMCGLMLPVGDRSVVSVFDNVLADIGDEQSIEQSLSTFSSHMVNIVDIINVADEKSLVLIDELGAGTDPVEGAALAISVLEAIHAKGAKIAATTHYAELKEYALQTYRVENGCCEFDVSTLRPTYRLLIGVPGRSNAFAISERLGMSKDIVDRARELVGNENARFEDVVDKLEQSRLDMEKERQTAYELKLQAEEILNENKKMRDEIAALREAEVEKAKSQALKITEQARREAYALLNELDQLKKEKDKTNNMAELARRARATVKRSLENIDSVSDPVVALEFDENYTLPRELKIGDKVIVADLGKEATVLSLPDKKENVEIQMGAMRTRVAITSLRLIENKTDQNKKTSGARKVNSEFEHKLSMAADTRLDLRGMTVDDCLIELDRFIDSSLRTGLNEFTIVHGKGTGALRSAVQKYLRSSPYVKSFRLGVYGEGENGVTIVELK